MNYLVRLAAIVVVFVAIAVNAAETYVSQFYVDSLVDNAIFQFNSLSDLSNRESHEATILHAKGISSKLRSIAEKDANKKYILSKVSELEYQIYLEEHALTLEKEQWNTKRMNQIVDEFNSVLGVSTPDFSRLEKLVEQLHPIDSSKAHEAQSAVKKRALSFRKELPDLISQMLENNELAGAHTYLAYCHNSAPFIGFSPAELARLEAKFVSRSTTAQTVQMVRAGFDTVKIFINNKDLLNAHRLEATIKYQVDILKKELAASEWNRYYLDYGVVVRKINFKEDSCTAAVEKLIRAGKITDAGVMIDTLTKIGVNPEKIAIVNKHLLESLLEQRQNITAVTIYAFDSDTDTSDVNPVFANLMQEAKTRVVTERDSAMKKRAANTSQTQVAEVRNERLRLSQELQRKRSEARRNSGESRAYDEMVMVFTYIEKDSLDRARTYYDNVKKLLVENMPAENISLLETVLRDTAAASPQGKQK